MSNSDLYDKFSNDVRQLDLEECIVTAQQKGMKDFYSHDEAIELSFDGDNVVMTKGDYSLEYSLEQWYVWRDGKMIQDAFPMLDASNRELIQTGITPQEWGTMEADSLLTRGQ